MVDRTLQNEECPKCGNIHPVRHFFVFRYGVYTKGGATIRERKTNCRMCRKSAAEKIWRQEHPGRVRNNNRKYYEKNKKL